MNDVGPRKQHGDQAQVQIVVRHLVDDAAGGAGLPGQRLQVAVGQAAGQAGIQAACMQDKREG